MIEGETPELAQVAYEARFRGMTLGPRGAAPAWADLGLDGRSVWQRVADEVVAAVRDLTSTSLAQARALGRVSAAGGTR